MKSFFKKSFERNVFYGGLILIFVLTISGISFGLYKARTSNDNVLAIVGGVKITQSDLNKRIWSADPTKGTPDNPEKVSQKVEEQLLNTLIEKEILKQNAARLGINVTDQEVAERIKKDGYTDIDLIGDRKADVEENTKINIIRERTQEKVLSWVSGNFIKVRFNRHFTDMLGGTDQERAADREYAKTLANDTYQKLVAGTLTFEQAEQLIQNDKTIDIKTFPGNYGNQFGTFDKTSWSYLFSTEAERNLVKAAPKETLVKPFVGKLPTGTDEKVDGLYFIVKVTDNFKAEADTYEAWLNSQKEKLQKSGKLSLVNKAYAEPYYVSGIVDAQYYDYNNSLTPINGIWFQLESDYASNPCARAGRGAYKSNWTRDVNGNVTKNVWETAGTNCYTTQSLNHSYTFGLIGACSFNNFRWTWGYGGGSKPEVVNGTIESMYISNTGSGSPVTDYNLTSGAWKTVLNDYTGTLKMRVRAKYYLLSVIVATDFLDGRGYVQDRAGGRVWSSPTGINCGSSATDCTEAYGVGSGAAPHLDQAATDGYVFDHWNIATAPGFDNVKDPGINVSMYQPQVVYVYFKKIPRLTVDIKTDFGSGAVRDRTGGTVVSSPAGINVGPQNSSSSNLFSNGSWVKLIPTATTGYSFVRWEVVNHGYYSVPTIDILMDNADHVVYAHFIQNSPPPADPSCSVTPRTGEAPLTIRVAVSNAVNYSLNFGDGTTRSYSTSPIYYTYSAPGSYSVSMTAPVAKGCNPANVTVNAPEESDSGEVSP